MNPQAYFKMYLTAENQQNETGISPSLELHFYLVLEYFMHGKCIKYLRYPYIKVSVHTVQDIVRCRNVFQLY